MLLINQTNDEMRHILEKWQRTVCDTQNNFMNNLCWKSKRERSLRSYNFFNGEGGTRIVLGGLRRYLSFKWVKVGTKLFFIQSMVGSDFFMHFIYFSQTPLSAQFLVPPPEHCKKRHFVPNTFIYLKQIMSFQVIATTWNKSKLCFATTNSFWSKIDILHCFNVTLIQMDI